MLLDKSRISVLTGNVSDAGYGPTGVCAARGHGKAQPIGMLHKCHIVNDFTSFGDDLFRCRFAAGQTHGRHDDRDDVLHIV